MLKRWLIMSAAVALLMLVVVPAAAGPKGTDRPFHADLGGEIEFEFFTECAAPGLPAPPRVTTGSIGQATHMGRVEANWEHCAGAPTGEGITNGELTMVAANGDTLVLAYGDPPTVEPNSFPMEITQGTGRFGDAAGTLVVTFEVEPQLVPGPCTPTPANLFCLDFGTPWPWFGSIEGAIDY